MRTELQRLQEELDVTTVYITHDQIEAMTMGDRVAVLNDGRLQQVRRGVHRRTVENLFGMELDGNTLRNDRFAYPFREANSGALGTADGVTLGIRPEDIEVTTNARASDDHAFESEIDVVEPMGVVFSLEHYASKRNFGANFQLSLVRRD